MATTYTPVSRAEGLPPVGQVRIVDVPPRRVLAIDGAGAPGSSAVQEALKALFAVGFTLRLGILGPRHVQAPPATLEGLWDLDPLCTDGRVPTWTLMLAVPDVTTDDDVREAIRRCLRRRTPAAERVRLETFREGLVAEVLYVGPYDAEGPTVARLREDVWRRGYRAHGRHHEIYVGDPRRSSPSRLRTVIRQPIV